MANWFVWILMVATTVNCSPSESCTNPDGEHGELRFLDDCDPLLALAHKRQKTNSEWNYLRKSTCGFGSGSQVMVCCPLKNDACLTPDGKGGRCVRQIDCSSLLSELESPQDPSTKDRYLLKKYKCGMSRHNVCCPSALKISEVSKERNTVCIATAKPPSPTSGCCGDIGLTDKIYGGAKTEIDAYPWLALIERRTRTGYDTICGGSLISALYVLTAAHCVNFRESVRPQLNVILGEYNTSSTGVDCDDDQVCNKGSQTIRVRKSIPYPSKHTGGWDDIALLQLAIMVTFTEFVKPICLPSSDITVNPPSDLDFIVAGWGLVDNKFFSEVKMHVKVPYVKLSSCISEYRRHNQYQKLWYKQICAGETGRDSCKGDSGGPLMYFTGRRFELVGIVSYGSRQCGGPLPAMHTNVNAYLKWIEKITHG